MSLRRGVRTSNSRMWKISRPFRVSYRDKYGCNSFRMYQSYEAALAKYIEVVGERAIRANIYHSKTKVVFVRHKMINEYKGDLK